AARQDRHARTGNGFHCGPSGGGHRLDHRREPLPRHRHPPAPGQAGRRQAV
ncbi:MAG: hypothetical protein AVDCRST_MAG33-1511, partial [uncultured Thermomicrobiales bacterium]